MSAPSEELARQRVRPEAAGISELGGEGLAGRVDGFPVDEIEGFAVRPGRHLPFGATLVPGGVNFSVYANHASAMTLVLYRRGAPEPLAELPFPASYRIGGAYAMTVFGLDVEEFEYGYRADGPFEPAAGHRYDNRQVLSDPYAKLLSGADVWGQRDEVADSGYRWRARVPYEDHDWEGDAPLRRRHEDTVVYELHVRGFTADPSSAVVAPGTYAGLVAKIPYLKELGVTCVELMPVFEFDELDNLNHDPVTGAPLRNYWGYSTVGFFAPKAAYAVTGREGLQADEFKNLVKHLHRAGIEIVLDVVFNHTAEGNEQGPTISFRGLDNATYYLLGPGGEATNYSGTGNTLNCNQPVVRGFVLDCLRYWAAEYHVDGFRFDLAAILGRAPDGSLLANPPLLESLAHDPVLRDCKLIAEAWDAAGLYEVGHFGDYARWSEWNGRYRDALRGFVKGDGGLIGEVATRISGSADLYGGRGATASVNLLTAHDGFTLNDLVSYDDKHNEANGEQNADGDNGNNAWNCGAEGPTDDPDVLALRRRQVRNLMLLMLTSRGIPMLVAGDEFGRTQGGNNNAYCQDNALSWVDWGLAGKNADLLEFTRRMIGFRAAHPCLRYAGEDAGALARFGVPGISWHGVDAWQADWSPESRLLAVMFASATPDELDCVYVAANAFWQDLRLTLPEPPHGFGWHEFADTAGSTTADGAAAVGAHRPGEEPRLTDQRHRTISARSSLVLVARPLTRRPLTDR